MGTHDGKGAHRVTKLAFGDLTPAQQQRVRWLNRNDLWLYGQAVRIFYERLRLYEEFSRAEMEGFLKRVHETSMRLVRLSGSVNVDE